MTDLQKMNVRNQPVQDSMGESGVSVFESRHGPAFRMALTSHGFPELLHVHAGSGAILLVNEGGEENRILSQAGTSVLVPASVAHRIVDDKDDPMTVYGLATDPRRFPLMTDLTDRLPVGRLQTSGPPLDDLGLRIRRLLYLSGKQEDVVERMSLIAGAIAVFADIASTVRRSTLGATSVQSDSIDDYLRWLKVNFFEDVSIDDAARRCGVSRRTFTAQIRERTGSTWLAFLHQLRIEHAVHLIKKTDNPITSIAFRCGFEEVSTFYRVFKSITGKKPGDLRGEG